MRALLPLLLLAHIGSPDTFTQAHLGPHTFLLAAHPPATYPGALQLDLRFNPEDHPTNLTASVDADPPVAIKIYDAGTATTALWLPTPTPHTIHIATQRDTYTLTLPAAPNQPQPTNKRRTIALVLLALALLGLGGRQVFADRRRLGFLLIALALAAFAAALANVLNESSRSPQTTLTPTLTQDGHINFTLTRPNQTFDDLTPDHGKLLHLFLIREPEKDVLLHLHPTQLAAGNFTTPLPSMPPGTYTLFADFYHRDGRNETATTTITLPSQQTLRPPGPDDTTAVLPPLSRPSSGPIAHLPDGYTITLRTAPNLHANTPTLLQVTLLDPTGQTPADPALYLGMSAHAVVLRTDDQVFAHIHPGGNLPMPDTPTMNMSTTSMAMPMPMPTPSSQATIPYGFPTPGAYRLFVQMQHGPTVETAAFDLTVQ